MKLIWHIAKKDLRRLALPVALWTVFVAGTAIWFRLGSPASGNQPAAGVVDWLAMMGVWTRLATIGQWVIGYVIVGALMVEDAPAGTDGFWLTRPIAKWQMLRAKLAGAGILFVVIPTAALAIVWLASGFALRDVWFAGREFALRQILMLTPALAIASLGKNLVEFLFGTVLVLVGYFLSRVLLEMSGVATRGTLLFAGGEWGVVVIAAIVLLEQFFTRRTARTRTLLALGIPAWVGVGAMWPGPSALRGKPAVEEAHIREERTRHPEMSMSVERAALTAGSAGRLPGPPLQANLRLGFLPARSPEQLYYAPAGGAGEVSCADGSTAALSLQRVSGWGEDVALGLVRDTLPGETHWNIYGSVQDGRAWQTVPLGEARLRGWIDVWLMRARVLGELPMHVGAEISGGSNRTRIVAMESPYSFERALVIEEHDVRIAEVDGVTQDPRRQLGRSERRQDVFVLVNRAARQAQLLEPEELGSIVMQGQIAGFRRLYIPSAANGHEWRRDAVIVKVRLEREARFPRTFETRTTITGSFSAP